MKKSISVVIPNYNGQQLLADNLPPLYAALRLADVPFEIIVSDDASTDDSVAFLRAHYPDIQVLTAETNSGFATTINRGIMAAQMELVFAMNSDIVLVGDYFTPQFRYFQLTDTFGVGGRIIGLDNDKLQDAAKYPQLGLFSGIKGTKNYCLAQEAAYSDSNLPSWFLSGANALLDREKVQRIGGFDPLFAPFYHEDVELGLRAWRLGWQLYYEHTAVCRHPNSATIATYHKRRKIQIIAGGNAIALHAIHLNWARFGLYSSKVFVKMLFKTAIGQTAAWYAWRRYWTLRPQIRASRTRLKSLMPDKLLSLAYVYRCLMRRIDDLNISRF